jgi:hypothetical protein
MLINAPPDNSRLSLFFDESLTSWKLRNHSLWRAMEFRALSFRDGDFGQLRLKEPIISAQLFLQLQKAAEVPDPWLLLPWNKQCCPRCWTEDLVSGQIPYARRSWRIAWHTCCPHHGSYVPVDRGTEGFFRSPLQYPLPPRWNKPDVIHFEAQRNMWTHEVLGRDLHIKVTGRRGLHIERALEGKAHNLRWYPNGIEPTLLRPTYAALVKALMRQFSLDVHFVLHRFYPASRQRRPNRFKADVWRALGLFYHLSPSTRFAVNVLAEAILSTVTDSPLPGDAGAHRQTQSLVRAINWDQGPPGTAKGTSPFESLQRLVSTDMHARTHAASPPRSKPNLVATPYVSSAEDEEALRLRIQRMRQFYRRRRALEEARVRENSSKIKAWRDPRERDIN